MKRFGFLCLALAVPMVFAGCGSGLAPVNGTLAWADGTPAKELEGGEIVFENVEKKISARGVIAADGTFKLRTNGAEDGCPVGTFTVAVVEFRKNANAAGTLLMPALMDPKFGEMKQSGLTATVQSGPNTITIKVERAKK
jgi:hypothetical protein